MYNVIAGGGNINIDVNKDITDIDLKYSFTKEECEKAQIIKLDDMIVSGFLQKNGDDFYLDIKIEGLMVLPCSVTLKPIEKDLSINIAGNLKELSEIAINSSNSIDIFPIVWENVLVEIPMKVTSDESLEKSEGRGWKFLEENETKENEFSKLKDLF